MAVAKDKEKLVTQSVDSGVRRPAAVQAPTIEPPRKAREQNENRLVRVFHETRAELRKVVWPTREETIRLTAVVLAISVVVGLILFVGDSTFLSLYGLLVNLVSGS